MIINAEPNQIKIRCLEYPCKTYWFLSTHKKKGRKCPKCGNEESFSFSILQQAAYNSFGELLFNEGKEPLVMKK